MTSISSVLFTITVLILFYKIKLSTSLKELSDEIEKNVTIGPVGSGVIVEKDKWGGSPAKFKPKLVHPTLYVIISHTVTPFCNSFTDCSQRVVLIQQYHFGRNYFDIGYNFLIGGDGNAYVGRGWDVTNFHANNSIAISFIGNYLSDNLTSKMVDMAKRLLDEGVEKHKLSKDYILIAHSQMFNTESPGSNVINVISKWPHYQAGHFNLE